MSEKRSQLRGSDCGSRFIAATARRIAARSGSLADMPRTERRVTTAPCARSGASGPSSASDEPPATRNARLSSIQSSPSPDGQEVSNVCRQTNSTRVNVSARGYRGWLARVVNAARLSFRGGPKVRTRNPETRAETASGFRVRAFARPGMTAERLSRDATDHYNAILHWNFPMILDWHSHIYTPEEAAD